VSPRWRDRGPDLAAEFRAAEPFPLLVLDDFLDDAFARSLVDEFPSLEEMPRSRDYVFGNKHELASVGERGEAARAYRDLMLSDGFRRFLEAATGYEDLFVDPGFFGGGFHQGGDGSYLDMHADFNLHPVHQTWLRTLNVLIYLNPDWKGEWGGDLLVKARPDGEPRRIEPLHNRLVVMTTDEHTLHGYHRMALPVGVTRKSLAAYAYREVGDAAVTRRTTSWVPEGAGPAKRFLARHYNRAVLAKNRLFGSRTTRNR
jgi:Rps23 Pro-64 3,4-dihydroxylase Tpa1-like proline 4-hydroxylase